MRVFGELKEFMKDNLEKGHLEFNLYDAHFQIYENCTDMCISVCDSQFAVIKFEERQLNIFTIAVTYNKDCIIEYAKAKAFKMTDAIVSLIDIFPNGYLIDHIVSTLLKI